MKKPQLSEITIMTAMQVEADLLIEEYNLIETDLLGKDMPFRAFTSDSVPLTIITAGKDKNNIVDCIATQPASLMAMLSIERIKPKLILNIGTAGGLKSKGASIGDVYVCTDKFYYHDRRIPIPGFYEYGLGGYDASSLAKTISERCSLKGGAFSTGNSLDMLEKDYEIILSNNAVVKDMESAAIAYVCELYKVDYISIKSITDLIDTEAPVEEEFLANLAFSTRVLKETVCNVINEIVSTETCVV